MKNMLFYLMLGVLTLGACKNTTTEEENVSSDSESTFDVNAIKNSLDSVLLIRDSILAIRNSLSGNEISRDALLKMKVNEFDAHNQGLNINQEQFQLALEYFENGTYTTDDLEVQCMIRKENAISTIQMMERIAFVYFTPDN
jgi:hypothetical protein